VKFLSIILTVHRLEVSLYNFYIAKQFQTIFAPEGEVVEVTVKNKEEAS
jgi:hypothetical protein